MPTKRNKYYEKCFIVFIVVSPLSVLKPCEA